MNLMQEIILKFITQSKQYHSPHITNEYSVQCTDLDGKIIRLTGNPFFDIRNADTNEIIAISNIPHNWGIMVGKRLPTGWELK